MNRSRAYYRDVRRRAINHKKYISRHYWSYKFDGQYSKGKIHCSCPICSAKSSRCGSKLSDIRKYDAAAASAADAGVPMRLR